MKSATIFGLAITLGWLLPVSPAFAVATWIEVTQSGESIGGAKLTFEDPAGNEIAKATTDRHGRAKVDLPMDAKVTLIVDTGTGEKRRTTIELGEEDCGLVRQQFRCGIGVSVSKDSGATDGGLSVTSNPSLTTTGTPGIAPQGGSDASFGGGGDEAADPGPAAAATD